MNFNGDGDYIPKNILVTGGAGFIGAGVVIHLVKKYPNYRIVNLDKLDYCSSLKNLKEIEDAPNYKFIKGNILSGDFMSHIMKSEEIDTIIHMAAQTHVDNSFGNSFQFTECNIMGTHVLLEAARMSNRIKRFVHVSTDEVYGEAGNEGNESNKHTENSLLKPTNPYAATKAGAEFLVQAYHKSFNLPVIITRGNNVFGPGQYPEKVIPKFVCLLEKKKPCYIHGKGTHKRSFIFIDDVVRAFDIVIHKGTIGQIYNIGTQMEISNLAVAKDLIKLFGYEDQEQELLEFVEDRAFNDFRYSIDFKKMENLGWKVEVSWEDGLTKTIQWYRDNVKDHWPDYEAALTPHPKRPTANNEFTNGFNNAL